MSPQQPGLRLHQDGIFLTPVTPDDHAFLYHCATSEGNAFLWRYHGQIPPFETFLSQLYMDVLAQFVVRIETGQPVGHVVGYAANLKSRHIAVGAVMAEAGQRQGLGGLALELFIDYLFAVWDFRGIYAEVPEHVYEPINAESATLTDRLPFEIVGRRPEFHYHEGRYWDDILFYLGRERWEASRQRPAH